MDKNMGRCEPPQYKSLCPVGCCFDSPGHQHNYVTTGALNKVLNLKNCSRGVTKSLTLCSLICKCVS